MVRIGFFTESFFFRQKLRCRTTYRLERLVRLSTRTEPYHKKCAVPPYHIGDFSHIPQLRYGPVIIHQMLSFADHSHKTQTFLWEDRGHRGSLSNDVLFHLTLSMYGVDTYCYTFAIYCKIVLNQFYSSFCFWACDTILSSLNWTWQFSNLWTWLRFG